MFIFKLKQDDMVQNFIKNRVSSIIVVFSFCVLVTLGTWQMLRLEEKKSYIKNVFLSLSNPTFENQLNQNLPVYSKIQISGEIELDKYMWLYRRHPLAKYKDGAYLMVPIIDNKGDNFLAILGWVEKKNHERMIEEIKHKKHITLTGLLLNSEENSILLPRNDYKNKICFTVDVKEIAGEMGMNLAQMFLAALDLKNEFSVPILQISSEMMIKVKNDHLEYAATWYGLALSLLLIYYIVLKKKEKNV